MDLETQIEQKVAELKALTSQRIKSDTHEKEILYQKIQCLDDEIKLEQSKIRVIENKIQGLQDEKRELSKNKCKYVGHDWDWDYDKGAVVEEVCLECGTWREY